MGQNVNPRKGAKSAPIAAPAPHPASLGSTVKSAPTAAPTVRSTIPPKINGDATTPTSVMSNQVDRIAPTPGVKDPNIGRTA